LHGSEFQEDFIVIEEIKLAHTGDVIKISQNKKMGIVPI